MRPCGSGNRYKYCHCLEGIAATPQATVTDQTLSLIYRALAAQRAGQLFQVGALYDQALLLDPLRVDALHMRGVVALSAGDTNTAIRLIKAAQLLSLDTVETRYNLTLATDAARVAMATVILVDASQLKPTPDSRLSTQERAVAGVLFAPVSHNPRERSLVGNRAH